ncbi:MAG: phosphoglucosamine mutase [Candidatus Velthaea sp.]
MGRLFGTDGVRGVANADLTPELAFKIGRAGAAVVARDIAPEHPILVGRDTRMSGPMLEAAIVAGITSTGRNVVLLGVAPTPAVASITTRIGAAAGVMISASHNPVEDNGIKFFGADGFKLSDAIEDEIEALLDSPDLARPTHDGVGIATHQRGLVDRYFATLIEAGADLSGLTVVVDAAYGAAFAVGPRAFSRLGARVVALHAEDDGSRINVACGTTHMSALAEAVRRESADGHARAVGVAFDGDADRALFVDETGAILSGDHVMLIVAKDLKSRGELAGDTVVGTVMSNVGLERAFEREGIRLIRAAVGDRYVLETMRAGGFGFGGEQSGHIIDLQQNTTGDGPMTAVKLLSIVARSGKSLHDLAAALTVYPQILVNVRVENKSVLESDALVRAAIDDAQRRLAGDGRILVRASGTEPLIRVMIEGSDQAAITDLAESVAATIRTQAALGSVSAGERKSIVARNT